MKKLIVSEENDGIRLDAYIADNMENLSRTAVKRLIEDGVKEREKMQIELTPTAGNEEFYKRAGFKYKPDVITGMYLWIKK